MKKLVVVMMLLPIAAPSLADMFQPSNSCNKPHKPYKFTSQYEVDSFKHGVERYKDCISDFVEEQKTAVRNHQEAASDAIDEWNAYVRHELN